MSTLPVFIAGYINTLGEEKSAFAILQFLPHWAQKKQDFLSVSFSIGLVRIESRDGITLTPDCCAAFFTNSSCNLGLGGGRKNPSGSLSNPSLVPNTPMSLSILS